MARIEREKQQQLENCSIRISALETEVSNLREESARQRGRAERLEIERQELGEQVREIRSELTTAKNLEHTLREQERR